MHNNNINYNGARMWFLII